MSIALSVTELCSTFFVHFTSVKSISHKRCEILYIYMHLHAVTGTSCIRMLLVCKSKWHLTYIGSLNKKLCTASLTKQMLRFLWEFETVQNETDMKFPFSPYPVQAQHHEDCSLMKTHTYNDTHEQHTCVCMLAPHTPCIHRHALSHTHTMLLLCCNLLCWWFTHMPSCTLTQYTHIDNWII